jgi:hypothetical protein
MKAAAESYKGIHYIQISSLPINQRDVILKSLNSKLVIKILKNDHLLRDCVQYQHYEFWYDNIFSNTLVTEEQPLMEKLNELIPSSANFQEILSAN